MVRGRLPLSVAVLLLLAGAGCGSSTAVYRVRPGDTLGSIAAQFGVSVVELARANKLEDPNCILVGQELRIPKRRAAKGSSGKSAEVRVQVREAQVRKLQARWQGRLQWPLSEGVVSSVYGARGRGFHSGVDISAPAGTPVLAAADGEVVFAGRLRGYGLTLLIAHRDGLVTLYAHNQAHLVREGQKVRQGQVIARVGDTGRTTGPNLHFEIRQENALLDPLLLLPPAQMVAPRRVGAWGG